MPDRVAALVGAESRVQGSFLVENNWLDNPRLTETEDIVTARSKTGSYSQLPCPAVVNFKRPSR